MDYATFFKVATDGYHALPYQARLSEGEWPATSTSEKPPDRLSELPPSQRLGFVKRKGEG